MFYKSKGCVQTQPFLFIPLVTGDIDARKHISQPVNDLISACQSHIEWLIVVFRCFD